MAISGTVELIASINTQDYVKGAGEIERANKSIEKSTDDTAENSNKSLSKISKIGLAGVTAAAVAVSAVIIKNIDNAVNRIDTLVAFPRILQALGATGDEAGRATKTLSDTLLGLPTSLQEGAKGVQQFVAAGLKVPKATDAFLAVNNALLAAGGNAQDTGIIMDSLTRAISGGSTAASTIQAALSRLPTAFQALQKESGLSADELYKLYAADPQKLTDDLIRLNKEGGGGLASLDEQARIATGGIATAFTNVDNAVTRGIASIITALGDGNLEAGQRKIYDGITAVGKAFGDGLAQIGKFVSFVQRNYEVFRVLGVVVLSIGVGLVAYRVAVVAANVATAAWSAILFLTGTRMVVVNGALVALRTTTTAATVAQVALNLAMSLNPIALVTGLIVGLVAVLALLFGATNNNTSSTDRLNAARQQQALNADAAREAEDRLRDANNGVERASISLERATSTYNTAVATYGAESIEAREAALGLKDANIQVEDSSRNLNRELDNQLVSLHGINRNLDNLNGKTVTYSVNGKSVIEFEQNGQRFFGGGFATGGFTGRGGINEPAGTVHRGEFVLPQNLVNQSTGLPDLDRLIGTRNSEVSSSNAAAPSIYEINVTSQVGTDADARNLARRVVDAVTQIEKAKGI